LRIAAAERQIVPHFGDTYSPSHTGLLTDDSERRNDAQILSDADRDEKSGEQYAQNRGRSTYAPVNVNGTGLTPTPGQAARLEVATARWQDAISQVRQIDTTWKPQPSFTNTVEGYILRLEAETFEAESRLSELRQYGIGPGPFASEWIPARDPGRTFTDEERDEINRIGRKFGCHTCGDRDPKTKKGNFVPDHQPPSARNPLGSPQRLYPQCLTCSRRQGAWITNNRDDQ
jgi:hypothetical protein